MKKILFLMAACFTLVACGGEQRKNDKNNDATEQSEAKAEKSSVDDLEAQMKAMETNDVKKYVDLAAAAEKLEEGLKEDELKKQAEEFDAWVKDEKKNDATEQKAEAMAPATLVEFAEAMCAAAEAGDVKKFDELDKAAEEHAMELDKPENKEQLEKETKELMEWVEKNGDRLMKAQQKFYEAQRAQAEENDEE